MFDFIQGAVTVLLGAVLLDTQLEALVYILTGLLKGEQAGIAAIAVKMPGPAKAKSRKNRVYRFVSNPRVNVVSICMAIIRALGLVGRQVVVATDWTEIGPLSVLTSAVVTDGRAIPIFWTVILDTETRKKAVEVGHMRKLSQMLEGVRAIHVLDRGFDDGAFLAAIGTFCKYVVRASIDFSYRKRGETDWKKMVDFDMKRGRRHDLGEIAYTKTHGTKCRLVAFHDHMQKEPWILVTNIYGASRAQIVEWYATRFRIEESFKDLKDLRAGFGLHGYRMEHPDHLSRLLAVVVIGYLLVTGGGHFGEERGAHRERQGNTRKERELAAWRVGLDLIQESAVPVEEVLHRLKLLALCIAGYNVHDVDPPWKEAINSDAA